MAEILNYDGIAAEQIAKINAATKEELTVQYLPAGTYVQNLMTEGYSHQDANYINDKVRTAIMARARALNIDVDKVVTG